MSSHTPETDEERTARYERGDFEISPTALIQTRDEFRDGDIDLPLDPSDLAELERLHAGGRPSLSGTTGSGRSPKRQVRLPVELDDALTRRAEAEHRRPSEILRDALTQYLRAS